MRELPLLQEEEDEDWPTWGRLLVKELSLLHEEEGEEGQGEGTP